MKSIELLSPARDVATAREAILHGADAVYIGAPRFGARASAGNAVEDIQELVEFAHVYRVRVYVTLNTILYDNELEDARALAVRLYEIGVDALIVQDMAFLEMGLPPIQLHASTQMDNRSAEKVQMLYDNGFEQVVLARELSLEEIQTIHHAVPDVQLEAFVHGATCVSYNGQCYASQYCFGRSANRGECAQFCRLPFDLIDADGRIVTDERTGRPVAQRHLLSLHDMNRSEDVEAMMDAGIVSFKIEGRLKDVAYVKNVTAYYRYCIDEVIRRRPREFCRSSIGQTTCSFTPQLDRTFNRGFSSYFLHGRSYDMVQQFSPKSLGQPVGHVKEIRRNCFTVSTTVPFCNGDGLCYIDAEGRLQGFRVNRVEGNCLFPKEMPDGLRSRMPLFRNYDQDFIQHLSKPTAERRIPVSWQLSEVEGGLSVALSLAGGPSVRQSFVMPLEEARSSQRDNIVRQLSRLGDTPFVTSDVDVQFSCEWFIPSSVLADWRRQLTNALVRELQVAHRTAMECNLERSTTKRNPSATHASLFYKGENLSYLANVSNALSQRWHVRQGASSVDPAMECGGRGDVLMTLRYCPRYELGLCGTPHHPLFLRSADRRVFPLRFDCRRCMVQVLSPFSR
ncbi:MAG: U32 family peptidase [Bacteroidaceae bacterium]|nr:U32 family peptidase [Bacteroidaceae bacterium]